MAQGAWSSVCLAKYLWWHKGNIYFQLQWHLMVYDIYKVKLDDLVASSGLEPHESIQLLLIILRSAEHGSKAK